MITVVLLVFVGFYLIYDTRYLTVGTSLNSEQEDPLVASQVVYLDFVLNVLRLVEVGGKIFLKTRL